MTSVPYVFETLSRYFESKQYRNPGQDVAGKNGTYGHLDSDEKCKFSLWQQVALIEQQQYSISLVITVHVLRL